jgi:cyanophycinase
MGMLTLLALTLLGVEPDTPRGQLVIIGGGSAAEEIRRQTLELAGGPDAHVVVIGQASGDPEAGERAREKWIEAGAKKVTDLKLDDPAQAVAAVLDANLIYFRGGSQTKLMNALAGTGVPEAIRTRFRQGAVISGTSAGAAVMSHVMIAGNNRRDGTPWIAEGLGLWPDVIVDQHFLRRKRESRLRTAVLNRPDLIGVGIDEATAVLVSGRVFEVLGASSVVVMDARKAGAAVGAVGPGESPDLQTFNLKAGMKYDLDKGVLGN